MACCGKRGASLGNRKLAEVKHRRSKHGRSAGVHRFREMIERARAARSDHRDRNGGADGAHERQIVSRLHPVSVHGGQQDLSGAARSHFRRKSDSVNAGRLAAAMGVNLPPAAPGRARIDRRDDALRAEPLCRRGNQRRIGDMDLVNVGTAGKPKDADPRAMYALIEIDDEVRATFPRVEYDVEAAARAIEETDLPREFAAVLRIGGG